MGLSSIASEQRAKEAEALRSVLIFSLVGSLALHLGLLSLGISNFLNRAPEIEEEPLEVVIVDPPAPKVAPPTPKVEPKQELPQPKNSLVGGSSLGRGSSTPRTPRTTPRTQLRTTTRTPAKPTPRVAPSPAPTPATRQPIPDTTAAQRKLIEDLQKAPVRQPKPEVATSPPQPAPTSPLATNQTQQIQPSAPARTSTQDAAGLREQLNNTNRGSGGSGFGTATGTGSGQRNSRGEGSGVGDAEGSGSGVACRRNCKPKYPELARRQGKEGRVAVRVVTDGNGNVVSAEVTRSSGNADLDATALKQARRAKVDASPGKPVTMNFTFTLKD